MAVTNCCWHDCPGRCLLKVHVKDGVIVRIETDDGAEPQLRACARGRAQRQRELLEREGVETIRVCLHVGPGTFKPVKTETIEEHVVDPEMATLSPQAAAAINRVRSRGGKIVAVGTTSVRTLESAPIDDDMVQPFSGMVDLYVRPGYRFKLVDHLVTNFHLPKSSLLILVSALAGRERILSAYQEAIEQRLRFYSYGDAMLIV